MKDVEIEEESFVVVTPLEAASQNVGFSGFLLRRGLVKDITRANYLLVAIAVICLLLTTLVSWKVLFPHPQDPYVSKEEEQRITPGPFNRQ
jgi:hypothetical protein